ncbi:MAG: aminoacyl-tRNA hydrolase [bacterium]
MKLIIGLGNPGKKYENTRHNIGFKIIDNYLDNPLYKNKFNADYVKMNLYGKDVIFVKPNTFMNLSGDSIIKFVKYFDIDINDILVIQDDLDMTVGKYKLKKSTSSGGHNGIKSIESVLNSKDFARLKIGILNEYKNNTIDFVLNNFSSEDMDTINAIDTRKIIDLFIKEDFDKIVNVYKA